LRARAGIAYVVLNLAGSALFLVALALVYGTLGTLNIADMSLVLPQVPDSGQALVRTAMAFLVIVFALKAALLPLSFWLPLAYGSAAAAVAALFAVLTKVGVYALLRVSQIVFPAASFTADLLEPWLVVLAVLTIATGTIGALAAARLATIVAYLVVMSTGSLLAAIAVPGVATNAAVIYYIIHSTLITGGFFLLADTIAGQRGVHGDQIVRGARMRDMGSLGAAFLVLGIGVSGVPPLSGFFGKFMIMKSVQESDWMAPVWTALLFSSLLVALALARAASVIFWEPRSDVPSPERVPPSRLRTLALVFLLAASPALTVATAPVSGYAHAAAEQLIARQGYVSAVLGTAPDIRRELRPR
jgi:multicomponent K+:H+ antiporter subunit D